MIFTYSTNQGGSELNAYKILKLSTQTTFDWIVLNGSNSELTKKIKDCENLGQYISLDFLGSKSMKIFQDFGCLINILKAEKYQTVYAVGFIPALLISLLKPLFRFRLVSTRRERMPWAKYYHRPFINYISLMSDYIETNSKTIEEELKNSIMTKNKVYFIPNIIMKSESKLNDVFKKNMKYIGNVANVREAKNIDLFLSVALKIIKQRDDVVFILSGKDSSQNKVKNFIHINELADRLMILEYIDYEQVFSIYKGLDIFFFTSKHEGAPNVLYEAMSESVPIVASKIFATGEVINDGVNGYLCSLDNENEFIDKLNLLLDDKSIYDSVKSGVKEYFNKSNSMEIAMSVINEKIIWNV